MFAAFVITTAELVITTTAYVITGTVPLPSSGLASLAIT